MKKLLISGAGLLLAAGSIMMNANKALSIGQILLLKDVEALARRMKMIGGEQEADREMTGGIPPLALAIGSHVAVTEIREHVMLRSIRTASMAIVGGIVYVRGIMMTHAPIGLPVSITHVKC